MHIYCDSDGKSPGMMKKGVERRKKKVVSSHNKTGLCRQIRMQHMQHCAN